MMNQVNVFYLSLRLTLPISKKAVYKDAPCIHSFNFSLNHSHNRNNRQQQSLTMNSIILIITLTSLLSSSSSAVTTADIAIPSPSPPAPGGCADSVISFSPCLPYISAPPNDLSDEPSSQCCDIFNGSFDSGDADCLCYLVRQTSLLGFPLNATKLLSLSDLCFVNDSTARGNDTLDSICSGTLFYSLSLL